MKTKKNSPLVLVILLAVNALAFSVFQAAANVSWISGSLATNLWSDTNNWDSLTVPTNDLVAFANAGSTNLPGVVNNVADASTTLTGLDYKAQVSFVSLITNYHTTLLNPGVTLTIDNGGNAGALINVGDADTGLIDAQYYWSIWGTNAAVIAGNTNAPVDTQGLQATATTQTLANHTGVLDLSGLDNFTFAGGYVWVGASAANAVGATDRPVGKIYLARTNLIIANSSSANGAIRIGESIGNTPPVESQMELGQENKIYTAWLKIGGRKGGASQGGRLYLRPSLTNNNPTLKLRGNDGVARMAVLSIGDNFQAAGSSIGSRGTVELSGGTVDALVDAAYIGRSSSSTAAASTGAASGTLNWTAGIMDVTTLYLGYQAANSPTNAGATGTINLRGANASLVAGTILMGRDAGSGTGKGTGTLNVTGGTVTVANTITESNAGTGNGTSTINITNGLLTAGGAITVDNINLNGGVVSNAALLTATSLKGSGTIFGPVTILSNLSPGFPIGSLTISNNLVLSSTSSNVFEVNLDTLAADKVAGLSNIVFGGSLTVTNLGGTALATNGMIFKLFEAATYSGSFAATNLAALNGFVWDAGSLGTDGTLKLVAVAAPVVTNIVFQLTGQALDLSWPTNQIGWHLEGQTNALSTNWFTIAGSDSTNRMILTIDPTYRAAFFRLVHP